MSQLDGVAACAINLTLSLKGTEITWIHTANNLSEDVDLWEIQIIAAVKIEMVPVRRKTCL